jgi:hypothetical protein
VGIAVKTPAAIGAFHKPTSAKAGGFKGLVNRAATNDAADKPCKNQAATETHATGAAAAAGAPSSEKGKTGAKTNAATTETDATGGEASAPGAGSAGVFTAIPTVQKANAMAETRATGAEAGAGTPSTLAVQPASSAVSAAGGSGPFSTCVFTQLAILSTRLELLQSCIQANADHNSRLEVEACLVAKDIRVLDGLMTRLRQCGMETIPMPK